MFRGGKTRALLAFLGIAGILLGGLGWATYAALRLEREHRVSEAVATEGERLYHKKREEADATRLALWRLDSRLAPALAREESRPYPQYFALDAPFPALTNEGLACAPGQVYLPSPLLTAEIPDWMHLHFQVERTNGWTSPQVIPEELQRLLRRQPLELALNNVTPERLDLLERLKTRFPAPSIMTTFAELGVTPMGDQPAAANEENFNGLNSARNDRGKTDANGDAANSSPPAPNEKGGAGRDYLQRVQTIGRGRKESQGAYSFDDGRVNIPLGLGATFPSKTVGTFRTVDVQLGPLQPVWLPSADRPDYLVMVRGVLVNAKPVYQGFVIDWAKMRALLADVVADSHPSALFTPVPPGQPPHPERAMTAFPVEFDPGEPPVPEQPVIDEAALPAPGWTPLRVGLGIAWVAVLVALIGVGLGGWSILDLSDRRIRFVSAVTHELRTPLTTLRLYLDMLSSGFVTDEQQRTEYFATLNGEADRLHRLIGNVLDFARLEKSRPSVTKTAVPVAGLLDQLYRDWSERCAAAGKLLVVENRLPEIATVTTDGHLVEQIVGNLIDNAQKYSRDAADPAIVLRAFETNGRLAVEVEDRGPGVTKRERCSIFRPFRRGHDADVKAGGVGLGLALATRWAQLLGGSLAVAAAAEGTGACFRLEVPGVTPLPAAPTS